MYTKTLEERRAHVQHAVSSANDSTTIPYVKRNVARFQIRHLAPGSPPPPPVDLFESRCNSKCNKFFSWFPDPGAQSVDAFTLDWGKVGFFWAFPPFALILRCLPTIRAEGILVVPYWVSQPWFPLFKSMQEADEIRLDPDPDRLLSPCRSVRHPLYRSLELIAVRLSGERSIRPERIPTPPRSFWLL